MKVRDYSSVVRDGSLESVEVGTNHLLKLLPVLENKEGRHGADTEFLCDVWNLVNVEFVEACVGVLVGKPMMKMIH